MPTDPNTTLLAVLTQDFAVSGTQYVCGEYQNSAIFDATGVRYRELPLTPQRILDGLKKSI